MERLTLELGLLFLSFNSQRRSDSDGNLAGGRARQIFLLGTTTSLRDRLHDDNLAHRRTATNQHRRRQLLVVVWLFRRQRSRRLFERERERGRE